MAPSTKVDPVSLLSPRCALPLDLRVATFQRCGHPRHVPVTPRRTCTRLVSVPCVLDLTVAFFTD